MIEVYPNLFVGSAQDFPKVHNHMGWAIVQAAKEPFHRRALGYSSRGAPKEHPEYLVARRGMRLILNLIDSEKYWFIPQESLDEAVVFIDKHLSQGLKVLVHCNMGVSRGPSVALLYLIRHTDFAEGIELFETLEKKYKRIYPLYNPSGIRERVRQYFEKEKEDKDEN